MSRSHRPFKHPLAHTAHLADHDLDGFALGHFRKCEDALDVMAHVTFLLHGPTGRVDLFAVWPGQVGQPAEVIRAGRRRRIRVGRLQLDQKGPLVFWSGLWLGQIERLKFDDHITLLIFLP